MAIRINHKDNSLQFNKVTEPASPPAGTIVLYFDSASGALTLKDDGGAVSSGVINPMAADLDVNDFSIVGKPPATVTSAGGDLTLTSGDGGATSGAAGDIILTPGLSAGNVPGNINLIPKIGVTSTPGIRFYELPSEGSNYTELRVTSSAAAPLSGSYTWFLPPGPPVNGQFLKTDGSGFLSFGEVVANPMTVDLDVGGFDIIGVDSTTPADLNIQVAGVTTGANATGNITIVGGRVNSGATTTFAGNAELNGGVNAVASGSVIGGAAKVQAGTATASVNGTGGNVLIAGGDGGQKGGDVHLQVGRDSTDQNTNGSVYISANGNGVTPQLRFNEDDLNGAQYVGLKAPDAITANVVWTLPDDTHLNADGKYLTAAASGILSFTDVLVGHLAIPAAKTANYTLVLADDGKMISMNLAGVNTLTIPLNASVAFPIGTQILIEQLGAGQTTIAIAAGTDVLNSAGGLVLLASQYSTATIVKTTATRWILMGDLA